METEMNALKEQKPEVTETVNTENADLRDAENRFFEHLESASQSLGKSLEEVWKCGQALSEVRDLLPRGQWGKWLKSKGIPTSTAYYWIKYFTEVEFSNIWKFDSVDQTFKALESARRKRKESAKEVETEVEVISGKPEEATGGDAPGELSVDIESAQEIQELDKLGETEDQLPAVEKETAELRKTEDKLREANQKIADLSQENTDLRKENTDLRQENEQLKRQVQEYETSRESTPDDQQKEYSPAA